MIHLISPHYTSKKLEPPFFRDLVDVFEDRMRYWILCPAKKLLEKRNEQVAAVGILLNYFEGIEIYLTGKDSKENSFAFFCRGFSKVFSVIEGDQNKIEECAKGLYVQARCGFSHDGLFRNRVFFKDSTQNAIVITWPKDNGKFIFSRGVESIIINPVRFYKVIEIHFENYLKKLKERKDEELIESFKKTVDLKWGLEIEYINVGMMEEEFKNNKCGGEMGDSYRLLL
jgi:hypothetical protein